MDDMDTYDTDMDDTDTDNMDTDDEEAIYQVDNKGGVSMQVPGWRRIGMTKLLKRKTGGGNGGSN